MFNAMKDNRLTIDDEGETERIDRETTLTDRNMIDYGTAKERRWERRDGNEDCGWIVLSV